MRISFLIALFLLAGILPLPSSNISIEETSKRFCDTLKGSNISHYSTREKLQRFFKQEESLSDYIVYLYYTMDRAKFEGFEVIDCSIENIQQISESKADIRYKLIGKGLLFFHKKIEIVDRWEKDGIGWHIIPPEKITRGEEKEVSQ